MSTFQLPVDYQAEQDALARKRKIAEMLAQQSQTPQQGQMVGGHYIAPSPLSGLLQLGQTFLADKMQKDLDTKQAGLASRYRGDVQSGLDKFFKTYNGGEGVMNEGQVADLMLNDQAPQLQATPGNPHQAVIEAMASGLPALQQIGAAELPALLRKGKATGLETKDLLPYADPASIPALVAQGVPGFKPKAGGKRGTEDVSVGNGQWQSYEVDERGVVDLNKPIGKPFSKRPTASDVSVSTGDAVPKELAKVQPEIFKELRATAQTAIKQIHSASTLESLLQDPTLATGAFAKPELFMKAVGAKLGFTGPEAVAKTQAALSLMAQSTLANVKQLPGPLSEKELPFLEMATAGQLEFTPQALLHLARVQKAAAHNLLQDTYKMHKNNLGLPNGDVYGKAYPLPSQGTYELDPKVYNNEGEGNYATLREQGPYGESVGKPAGGKPSGPIIKNW